MAKFVIKGTKGSLLRPIAIKKSEPVKQHKKYKDTSWRKTVG